MVNVLRKDAEEWIQKLTDEEKRAIRKYTYNSGDKKPYRFFERLNAMLRGDATENEILMKYADVIAYRGMSIDPSFGIPVGGLYRPKQFFSTSVVEKGS